MDDRTVEIIMICKGKHELGNNLSKREAIAHYMSNRCLCHISEYDERTINSVLVTAALDYIDSVRDRRPSSFIKDIMKAHDFQGYLNKEQNWYDAIIDAFVAVPVRRDDEFIDGFTEENTMPVERLSSK